MKRIGKIVGLVALLGGVLVFFIARKYIQPDIIQGDRAPNFTTNLLNGDFFELEQLRGSYVLLDFWASWCAPCRKDNPNLVKLYDEFHGQTYQEVDDFHIVSVALERREGVLEKAIEKDGLRWDFHLTDYQEFEGAIPQRYGIRSIPSKLLINSEGVVVAVNPSVSEVTKILQKQLTISKKAE